MVALGVPGVEHCSCVVGSCSFRDQSGIVRCCGSSRRLLWSSIMLCVLEPKMLVRSTGKSCSLDLALTLVFILIQKVERSDGLRPAIESWAILHGAW